jgi:hypothetical protein
MTNFVRLQYGTNPTAINVNRISEFRLGNAYDAEGKCLGMMFDLDEQELINGSLGVIPVPPGWSVVTCFDPEGNVTCEPIIAFDFRGHLGPHAINHKGRSHSTSLCTILRPDGVVEDCGEPHANLEAWKQLGHHFYMK